MSSSLEDEVRFTFDALRLLGEDVESQLLARGWAVTNLDVGDSEPLEWFWPPTAPIGHGGVPESSDVTMPCRAGMHVPRQTPWM